MLLRTVEGNSKSEDNAIGLLLVYWFIYTITLKFVDGFMDWDEIFSISSHLANVE